MVEGFEGEDEGGSGRGNVGDFEGPIGIAVPVHYAAPRKFCKNVSV